MNYYIANSDGSHRGPYTKSQLLSAGLTPQSLVWCEGMPSWQPASQIKELSDLLNSSSKRIAKLQRELKQSQREVAELAESIAELEHGQEEKKNKLPPMMEAPQRTRYDFPCPTWTIETLILLACVAVHFMLGITGRTTFYYIFLDLIGAALCITALVMGSKIKKLNAISYSKDSTSRTQADKLTSTLSWLVSMTAIAGFLIILIQSSLDMLDEGIETAIVYAIFYLLVAFALWFHFFKPTSIDSYSLKASPTLKANKQIKRNHDMELLRRNRRRGGDNDDYDSDDYDDDYDSNDYDYDSDDDWGGGDSGGGGADSSW